MEEPKAPGSPRFSILPVALSLALILIFASLLQYRPTAQTVPYSQFIEYVDQGNLNDVSIGPTKIYAKVNQPPISQPVEIETLKVDDPALVPKLKAQKVPFRAVEESNVFSGLLTWLLPIALLYFVFMFFMKRSGVAKGGGLLPISRSKAKIYAETDLRVRFEDVAGVDEAKEELREIVSFLKDPSRFNKLGGRMPKGVLLVGPPGTGKTLLARAVAGEANVPFFSINGSEFVELFVGLGAARVRDLFEQARHRTPCIVFIDELDALGKARGISAISGGSNDEKEQTLNQLLAEMDGFDPALGIVLLAATNRPEVLDPALLRAGRFDRQVFVDKPDRLGREKILKIHMGKITMSANVDIGQIAGLTTGFSGADLANLANEAALIATRRGALSVELEDFTQGVERIVAGLERKSRYLSADEKKRVAWHEMGHAVVALALGKGEVVHKVSVIPRGIGALGYTMRRPTEDRYLMRRHELEANMAIALGGRAAEELFCEDISTGAGDDLDKATEIARAMVMRYGMDERLGLATFERDPTPLLGGQMPVRSFAYSEETARVIDNAIGTLLRDALRIAENLVRNNRTLIEEGVAFLLARETIDEAGLRELWQRHHAEAEAGQSKAA